MFPCRQYGPPASGLHRTENNGLVRLVLNTHISHLARDLNSYERGAPMPLFLVMQPTNQPRPAAQVQHHSFIRILARHVPDIRHRRFLMANRPVIRRRKAIVRRRDALHRLKARRMSQEEIRDRAVEQRPVAAREEIPDYRVR
ncbi:hypothetical protein V502_11518 [Pseudogymnoascus sp. VKM F-4520 (FW-2644)]|nr:hypothetical protein V502_11518 [Pseudogymnoascus sp. VKM F-4520 (FW-2644)]